MKLKWPAFFGVLVLLAALLGCSGAESPALPAAALQTANRPDMASASHYLWGYWAWIADPSKSTLEIVPLRQNALHVNVLKFLESGIPNLTIKNLVFDVDQIDVDVLFRHPFPGLSQYTGFDVRGIFITPGSVSGYDDSGIVHAASDETHLENADGLTRWWNPSEFPVGNTMFGYINGKLGNPYDGSNLNATLNGYRYFCDDLQLNDPLDELVLAHRGMFGQGVTNERHYTIHFNPAQALVFNYAVDASWEQPDPNPPTAVPNDFPPEANAPEAYRLIPRITQNDLFYIDGSNKGGHAILEVDAYDWWGCG